MAKIQITNVRVLDNPSSFLNPIQLEITFECMEDLEEDLEWKVVYVGSAENESLDQTLDSVLVGPIPAGRHMFVFQANAPDPARIPDGDLIGVAALILTCAFREREFVRVGYYVNNDYDEPEMRGVGEDEDHPTTTTSTTPVLEKLKRDILASKPIVTRYKIDWGEASSDANGGEEEKIRDDEGGDAREEENKENDVPVMMSAAEVGEVAAATTTCGSDGGETEASHESLERRNEWENLRQMGNTMMMGGGGGGGLESIGMEVA